MPLRYIPALVIFIALIIATAYLYNEESTYISGMKLTTGIVSGLDGESSLSITSNRKNQAIRRHL